MAKVEQFDRQDIFDQIDVEREYQDKLWGGPTADDQINGMNDWVMYITRYATKWYDTGFSSHSDVAQEKFRESMVKTAALAVAAIESTDRIYGKEK